MSGIVAYGAYIPFYRLRRETIAEALGTRAGNGARSVASYDEDATTMAVEAARTCLAGLADRNAVRALYLGTTAPPYVEKLNAAAVHAATLLPDPARAFDLACSVRAGMGSLLCALDAASAGGVALGVASDVRVGAPEGQAEQAWGDAAAAFAFGHEGVIAEVEATACETVEALTAWKTPDMRFAKSWEERFALTQVYVPLLVRAGRRLGESSGVKSSDVACAVIDAPNPRAIAAAAKALGLDSSQLAAPLDGEVGWTGAAHAPLMLAAALDRAKPGDRILVLSVSDGVDGMLVRATDRITEARAGRSVESLVASRRDDLPYTRYLKWRGLLETEPPRRPDPQRPAAPPAFRSEDWKFGFTGTRCKQCGTYQLPPQIVCVQCQAVGEMEKVPFADRKAHIRTFTVDRLAFTPQPPMVVAILDFEGGGRFQSELTDCEPEKVAIGQEVEMTFRRLFTADGVHNYFWKARPPR